MGIQQVKPPKPLRNLQQSKEQSKLRLLAPLRYLTIRHREKSRYDIQVPLVLGAAAWLAQLFLFPDLRIFTDGGLLRYSRELLTMAVPFMVGALGVVATGLPGPHWDEPLKGASLTLEGRRLTLRQFVCYLLGYLSFLGLVTIGFIVLATLIRDDVVQWSSWSPYAHLVVKELGIFALFIMLSALSVTVFWSLYFLTDVVNDTD